MLEELAKGMPAVITIIPAVIAMTGVILGSFITYKSNFKLKSLELKHQLNKQYIDELRKVSAEYLAEVNSSALLSFKEKGNHFEALRQPNYLLSQIELLGSEETFSYAKEMFEILLNFYVVKPDEEKPDEENSDRLPIARSKFIESLKKEIKQYT